MTTALSSIKVTPCFTWRGQNRARPIHGPADLPINWPHAPLGFCYHNCSFIRPYLSSMAITRFEDLDLTRQYTFANYVTWHFSKRVEILRGWVARIRPALSTYHQRVSTELQGALFIHLKGSNCQLFAAPFDVRLPRTKGGESVVQPDLCVACDPSINTKIMASPRVKDVLLVLPLVPKTIKR